MHTLSFFSFLDLSDASSEKKERVRENEGAATDGLIHTRISLASDLELDFFGDTTTTDCHHDDLGSQQLFITPTRAATVAQSLSQPSAGGVVGTKRRQCSQRTLTAGRL
jgi:hypothetical protein